MITKEDTIPEEKDDLMTEDLEAVVVEHIEFECGDSVVYPHHGAGKVLMKPAAPGANRINGRLAPAVEPMMAM